MTTVLCLILVSSCGINRHIPEGKRLVHKVKVRHAPKQKKESLYNLIEEKPNRRIFGLTRFHLRRYAWTSTLNRTFGWEVKGEPPSLYSEKATKHTAQKMEMYLKNEGYFNARVSTKVIKIGKRKIKVIYLIDEQMPYTIAYPVNYNVKDSNLLPLVKSGMRFSYIKPAAIFSSASFSLEQERITNSLRTSGYYDFSKDQVHFDIDSSAGNHQVRVTIRIENPRNQQHHVKSYFNEFVVNPDFIYNQSTTPDTFQIADRFTIIGTREDPINELIHSYVYVKPGDPFNLQLMQQSLRKLRALQQFKYIDLAYQVDSVSTDSHLLNVNIKMTPYPRYRYNSQLELNTSQEQDLRPNVPNRLYGMAGGLSFTDINFLNRSIQAEMSIRLAAEISKFQWPLGLYSGELGISNAYYFPKPFLHPIIPDRTEVFITSSSLRGQLFRETNPDYRRSTATINLGYVLKKDRITHVVSPVEFSLVGSDLVSDAFKETIENSNNLYLKNLFDNHVISASRWMVYYNGKPLGKHSSYWDIQLTLAELAGNSFYALSKLTNSQASGGDTATFAYTLAGMNYFQYYKGDYDFKFHQKTFFGHEFVYRAYLGLMIPFGNSPTAIPFEKRYYSGGSNGIRGWAIRELGPGTFDAEGKDELIFLQSGDIKLELNWEYRFELSETLKMALFVDAGNVWNHPRNRINVEGGYFGWNTFYKQLAVAGGFGTRFDFNYFVFRLDLGFPLRDPTVTGDKIWFSDKHYAPFKFWETPQLNFGIGYPF